MPLVSVGDMAQQFISMRNGGAIKTELASLAESLSTGRVADITAALRGETTQLSGMNHSLTKLAGYEQAGRETSQILTSMQTLLAQVDTIRGETAARLLILGDASTGAQVDEAGRAARDGFGAIVDTLNTRLADRSLMGGREVVGSALASAETMLADIRTAVSGATTTADIIAAIDTWFDDPAGGFATMGYLGDTGAAIQKRVSDSRSYEIDLRADDPTIVETLKAAAMAAIAADMPGLSATKSELLQQAGLQLFSSADGIAGLQSRVGYVEAELEQVLTEASAEKTALSLSKNALISADPFDTASRLQGVQLQLETHYSVTARLSQISLLEYI